MSGVSPTRLLEDFRANRASMVKDIGELVSIETPSRDPAALDSGLAWIEQRARELLGQPAQEQRFALDELGTALALTFPGSGRVVTILCHYDTVFDLGTTATRPWEVDGAVGRGPGCFDMKGGIVQALWAAGALNKSDARRPTLRWLFTPDEEIGSPGSRRLIEEAARGADAVLVFESAADGALKTARSGVGLFRIEVEGVASHAGLDPAAGASAIDELARAILLLHGAADHAAGTSVNVGVVGGGSRSNVVADRAFGEVDVRVKSPAEAERMSGVLHSLAVHDERAQLHVLGGWNRPVMERTAGNGELFTCARALGEDIGLDLHEVEVGGASDANFTSALGVPTLDGIGAVGGGAHSASEWIDLDSVPERAALAALLISALA